MGSSIFLVLSRTFMIANGLVSHSACACCFLEASDDTGGRSNAREQREGGHPSSLTTLQIIAIDGKEKRNQDSHLLRTAAQLTSTSAGVWVLYPVQEPYSISWGLGQFFPPPTPNLAKKLRPESSLHYCGVFLLCVLFLFF